MALLPNLPPSLWLRRDKLRQAQILNLEILQCMVPLPLGTPSRAVKIFAFLDLEQNCLFMDGHYLN